MAGRLRDEIRQTRPFTSPEHEAYLSLGRTWAVLDHAAGEMFKGYGITPTQYNVLRILRGAGESGLCRAEVMERMVAQVPDATRLLDRMEAAGLIRRERSSADRRFVTTHITAAGLALLTELDEPVRALHRRHLATLRDTEVAALIDMLERIRSTV